MKFATLTKVFAGVSVLAVISTTAFWVLPRPESNNGVWLDTPLDKAEVEAGDVRIVLHSDLPGITNITVRVSYDGNVIKFLLDDDIEKVERGAGAPQLSVFDQTWSFTNGGEYTLEVLVSGSTETKRSFTMTVLDQDSVNVDTAQGTSEPTLPPGPTAMPVPTEMPTSDPGLDGPLIVDSVTRFQIGHDDWASYFRVNLFSPQSADVAIELRITDSLTDTPGDWQVYPCYGNVSTTSPGLYECVIPDHYLEPQASFQIDGTWVPFSVEYRAVISAGGVADYAPGGTWQTERR